MDILCISPIDGRYKNKTSGLNEFFSELGLIKYRLKIETSYLLFLFKKIGISLSEDEKKKITSLVKNFDSQECMKIKLYEHECNHDVKAVEYYMRQKINIKRITPFIHFGLTSQDINNMSITLSIKDFIEKIYSSKIKSIIYWLNFLSNEWKEIVMISKTHGQPAVPTTLGKEFRVFSYRLEKQLAILKGVVFYGKFGGAVGNLNAHYFAYPEINWDAEFDKFVSSFGLKRERFTTQIDNYENLAVVFDCLRRINTVLVDLSRDIWGYISIDYLSQTFVDDEVGSSTMPQKINPIDFENSEGNLLLANNLLDFMSNKLPISRFQRDLTDSTVLRNVGSACGHILISFEGLLKGLKKITPNVKAINDDLEKNYSVLSEAIQITLRKKGIEDGYEIIKKHFRNNRVIDKKVFKEIVNKLHLDIKEKEKLANLTHNEYVGNSKMS